MFIIKNKISRRHRGTQKCWPALPQLVVTLWFMVQGSWFMVRTPSLPFYHKNYGNKKDVGVCLSRAYPIKQALALPLEKDKQLKPAHVNKYIYHATAWSIPGKR